MSFVWSSLIKSQNSISMHKTYLYNENHPICTIFIWKIPHVWAEMRHASQSLKRQIAR